MKNPFRQNIFINTVLTTVLFTIICATANAAPASPWQFNFTGAKGLSLSYQGVPIVRESTLYVVKPGWKGEVYYQNKQKQTIQKNSDGSLSVIGENENFRAQYTLQLADAQTFELHFKGELLKDVPAQMEFNAGYFNANLIANRPFHAIKADANKSTSDGIVPVFPKQEGLTNNDLVPGFQTLEFDSRLGKMTLSVLADKPMIFADARNYPLNWSKVAPVFWLGWMAGAQPLHINQSVEATLKIHLDEAKTPAPQEAVIQSQVTPVADAYTVTQQIGQVVPQPKKMQLRQEKYFSLADAMPWSITAPDGETRLAPAIKQILDKGWNISLSPPRTNKSTFKNWSGIRIGSNKPLSFPASLTGADWANHTDSYQLTVDENGVQIVAPTARGVFYGIQTLAQLLYSKDKIAVLPLVQIEDWPTLQFRGAHWFPSQSGVPFDKKLIGVMARYKMNYAVIQCDRTRWDSHPEIAYPNSISTKDLRDLVQLCRANFIEPIPLINGPGHAEWMFNNKQHLELAEDPKSLHVLAPNNPQSLQLMHDVMNEAIGIFHPKYFHIGGDEIRGGRFPNPENPFYRKGQTDTDLIMAYFQEQRDWLAKRNIKTMMWGDMLLDRAEGAYAGNAPSVAEAQKRRAMLPKDVIITDWQYGEGSIKGYPSLSLFQKEGLQTIAATWYSPANIHDFTQVAINNNAWGLLQTTWAGFFPDAETLNTESRQFNAFILAGDYSWSGRSELPVDLPYQSANLWKETYAETVSHSGARSGAFINLDKAANVPTQDWLGLGKGWDLADIFAGQNGTTHRFGDVAFQIPDRRFVVLSNAPSEMAPSGALTKLQIDVNQKASEIAFLHAALWDVPTATKAARCIVEYTDGSKAEGTFSIGSNIVPWLNDSNVGITTQVWKGKSPVGTSLGFYLYRWQNPHPDRTIKTLILQPIDVQTGYALAGITLIN